MPDTGVFGDNGDFTPGFKFKICEYLKTIPLSDGQVDSITKALAGIIKTAQLVDLARQTEAIDAILTPVKDDCVALRKELKLLEGIVDSHKNQAAGMVKLVKSIAGILTLCGVLLAIFYQPAEKEDPNAKILIELMKELKAKK